LSFKDLRGFLIPKAFELRQKRSRDTSVNPPPSQSVTYRVCHWLRLTKRVAYFWVNISTSFKLSIIFGGSWGNTENWLEPKTELPSGNLACPNLWNALYYLNGPWAQFHQCSTYSFYARRSQKPKRNMSSFQSFLWFQDLRA